MSPRATAPGFVAFARGVALKPGQERRVLRRGADEHMDTAIARAAKLTWWPRVVDRIPSLSSGTWTWVINPEAPAP